VHRIFLRIQGLCIPYARELFLHLFVYNGHLTYEKNSLTEVVVVVFIARAVFGKADSLKDLCSYWRHSWKDQSSEMI